MARSAFHFKQYFKVALLVSIWINISEVFRYLVLVMPRVKSFFAGNDNVANMDWSIFAIWGAWDTLLTGVLVFFVWLYTKVFGNAIRSVLISGTIVWLMVFVIFWVATANMGLCDWRLLWIALPLSWVEMIVGAWIAVKIYQKQAYARI